MQNSWVRPTFEEIAVNGECTAYAGAATPSRRQVLAGALPAALAGTGLAALHANGQDRRQQGGKRGGVVGRLLAQAYANGKYQLPELPYEYDALEPYIIARIMKLHHDVHHQGYVNGMNNTLQELARLRQGQQIDAERLYALERDLSFNGSGHLLHTVFWATMAPKTGGEPRGPIAEAINKNFGSFESFQNYFTKVATTVKGSGWAVLVYEPVGDQLLVFQLDAHDKKEIAGTQPLLPLDVWEHAYYLQYQTARGEYVKAWWNVVNWEAVNEAYTWARSQLQA